MSNLPLVSVVVPTRNSVRTLRACLESIARQTYPRVETLVVDRHSVDGTREMAESLGVKVLSAGPERSAQRNAGAGAARGEWLLFVDSDMVLERDLVAACVRARDGGAALVVPELGLGGRFLARVRSFEKRCYVGNGAVEAARFFPRAAFLALGGYDATLTAGEDWDLTDRWRAARRPVGRAGTVIFHDDRALTLRGLLAKRYRYGRLYAAAVRKNRRAALGHLGPRRYLPLLRLMLREPLVGLGLVALKALETPLFALGLLAGWAARDDTQAFGRMRRSAALVARAPGERVLDVGCAGGWLGRSLGAARKVVGVDLCPPPDGAPAGTRFARADARGLPFAGGSFDIVTLFEVVEHVPAGTEGRALAEARRVLRPGGALLLSTPHRDPLGTVLDPAWWLRGHRHYRAQAVARLLEGSGFSDVALSLGGGTAEAFYVPLFYLFKRLGLRLPFETAWRRAIDREYRDGGRYTIFATARRPADAPAGRGVAGA